MMDADGEKAAEVEELRTRADEAETRVTSLNEEGEKMGQSLSRSLNISYLIPLPRIGLLSDRAEGAGCTIGVTVAGSAAVGPSSSSSFFHQ